jgi:predicted dienelactone hydrolase
MAHSPPARLLKAALTGLLLLPAVAASAIPAAASADPALHLVRPTGPHAVGRTAIYLNDTSRPDPWVPSVASRELMVSLWYPTDAGGGTPAPYMSAEESRLLIEGKRLTDLPPDTLSKVRTYAFADARPAGRAHSLPLVVLSPGYTQPRATLTALAEDLASRGYVVAGIDHSYETYAVTFPDGRIADCATCAFDHEPTFFPRLYQVRAADVSFVLDRLTGPRPAWRGARLIDASRIGMSGHSAGGASSISAMLADPRIDAGINMDGTTRNLVPDTGFARPFLFVGTETHSPGGPDQSWDQDFGGMTAWKRWLVVAGTDHSSFTDAGLFADQLGLDIGATTTGSRTTEIVRTYNAAMFDRHLRHRPQPLLDAPSAAFPEVTIAAR